MRPTHTAPAARALAAAQATTDRPGHEHLGPLSAHRGFLPTRPPLPRLPASHAAWDEAAAALPALFRDVAVREALDGLPVLPAGPDALPDAALQRAATVLGLLGHACVHGRATGPADLPAGVAVPWAQVRRRLGRSPEPVLTYPDLIVHNWRSAGGRDALPLLSDDLRLLVPVAGNEEERVFYLTQVEILARCAPVVTAAVAAQQAVLDDDAEALAAALATVTAALEAATRRSLPLIDPRPGARTAVDPVVWAKTVAPLAVPFRAGVLGPSGTASPVFGLLDALLGRRGHASQLGREILLHRRSAPPHWRRFLDAVDEVPVPAYVAARARPGLVAALDAAREAYAGPEGFLGRHRRKVSGYLAVAFLVGRGVTIGGFAGTPGEHTWHTVDAALTASRTERPVPPDARRPAAGGGHRARGRRLSVADVAEHNDDAHGWWVAVDGRVHDVTGFLRRHPGGTAALRAHAGLDATAAFGRAHPDRPAVRRLLAATDTGALTRPALTRARLLHEEWGAALAGLVQLQNAFRLDRSFGRGTELCRAGGDRPTALQADRAADTAARFGDGYLPRFAVEVLAPLAEHVLREQQAVPRRIRAVPGPPPGPGAPRQRLDGVDRRIAATKELLVAGARAFDTWGDAVLGRGELWRLAASAVPVCAGAATVAVSVPRAA
ncbi:Cytochrome b5-like Heme/Steroid binding domain-containing protein [Geodermatophilus telluris]|uniref:Cytochrome b5-like Heme/Steroid binding domain-containing protein n=1 Tax=Geodermatophilus telluris TaxID=1190417 RepID=A0A1G6V3J2_9ACTN|nr:cytochrome b5 domain-containing protein [Geodermatophilus telluris]SDD47505.1 Cytochrome b5-like Heme/Steroid binding domain-containing protein [Geodermatophilus telluris]